MRGIRSDIFGSSDILTEAVNIEEALLARATHYRRAAEVDIVDQSRCASEAPFEDLRSIIRDVVRGT